VRQCAATNRRCIHTLGLATVLALCFTDRNRYGSDDQYLATVVRYDLEFLGLCPCMVTESMA
jgi:hypothetical protein